VYPTTPAPTPPAAATRRGRRPAGRARRAGQRRPRGAVGRVPPGSTARRCRAARVLRQTRRGAPAEERRPGRATLRLPSRRPRAQPRGSCARHGVRRERHVKRTAAPTRRPGAAARRARSPLRAPVPGRLRAVQACAGGRRRPHARRLRQWRIGLAEGHRLPPLRHVAYLPRPCARAAATRRQRAGVPAPTRSTRASPRRPRREPTRQPRAQRDGSLRWPPRRPAGPRDVRAEGPRRSPPTSARRRAPTRGRPSRARGCRAACGENGGRRARSERRAARAPPRRAAPASRRRRPRFRRRRRR